MQNFTVNAFTICESGTQLEWRYRAIKYLIDVFVVVLIQNESTQIYFWFSVFKLYEDCIFRKLTNRSEFETTLQMNRQKYIFDFLSENIPKLYFQYLNHLHWVFLTSSHACIYFQIKLQKTFANFYFSALSQLLGLVWIQCSRVSLEGILKLN